MAYTQAQNKATQKYAKKTYDSIQFRVKKGLRKKYNEYAAKRGMSLAAYISSLIEADNRE